MAKERNKDRQPQGGDMAHAAEKFLLAGAGLFTKSDDLTEITIQNDYGTIVLKRTSEGKTNVQAIGFTADFDEPDEEDEDEDFDEEEYNKVVSKMVRWFD